VSGLYFAPIESVGFNDFDAREADAFLFAFGGAALEVQAAAARHVDPEDFSLNACRPFCLEMREMFNQCDPVTPYRAA